MGGLFRRRAHAQVRAGMRCLRGRVAARSGAMAAFVSGHARWVVVMAAAAVVGCATPPPHWAVGPVALRSSLSLGGADTEVEWTLPDAPALALVTLEHGWARRCSHLRGTARRLAASGLAVLCIEAPMLHGNPVLAEALAASLADGLAPPGGGSMPLRIVVAGHSAGAVFAARLGARLDALAPDRLAGALLFDPVDAAGLEADLLTVSRGGARPVLAIAALSAACNAEHSAEPALRSVARAARAAGRSGYVGMELTDRSTHVDVEGEDSDWVAVAACGRPLAVNTERVRALAARWAVDLAAGALPAQDASPAARAIEPSAAP